jgi:ABC-2 type transport system ATP-binding protein
MLAVEQLKKRFGTRKAVDGVSFTVAPGEVLGFLGPNGAGKSTTMRIIAGRLEPDGGRVRVGGNDTVANRRAAQALTGYLPEGAPAYPAMTPFSFVEFCLAARGWHGAALKAARDLALDRVHVGDHRHDRIATLSKGYKRRTALAAAIAHDPPVLILDEPTDGLDPNQKDEVRSLIRAMSADKAIVISTHILEEVPAVCSRAIIIDKGHILADATPEEIAAKTGSGRLDDAFRSLTTGRATRGAEDAA